MEYISFIHEQFYYGIFFFVIYQNIFRIGGMTISFHSYQMVKNILESMESTIPRHFIPKYCNPVAQSNKSETVTKLLGQQLTFLKA